MLGDPPDQLAAVCPIDPKEAKLFTGATESGQEEASTGWVKNRGRGNNDSHEGAQRIASMCRLRPFTFLPVS